MKHKPEVLIVEDTKHWQEIFVEIMISQGFQVEIASSYLDAKQVLQRNSFEMAIIDIRLSEGDSFNIGGMKLLEDIRNVPGNTTNVVIVSGYATVELVRDAFKKFNVVDFIEKNTFEEVQFVELIRDIQKLRNN